MQREQREFLSTFRKANLNAGCAPEVVDLCLTYVRYCFTAGTSVDFDEIEPSVKQILDDPKLTERQKDYLHTLREHFWQTGQIPENFAHLNLWYCYNLLKQGSAILFSSSDLARKLGLSNQALNYIASEAFPGYTEFEIPKSNGDNRHISAPVPKLRWIQRWVLDNVLSGIAFEDYVTAYVKGRSIRDNATPHLGAKVLVNLDLKSFFPSISFRRVLGIYLHMGYVYPVAVLLAKLCCHQDRLPQGAPTSPVISNLVCRKPDRRLTGLAQSMGFRYTRYADDITFSGSNRPDGLIRAAKQIIEDEGFILAERKTRITRRGQSQRVTGLVVSSKINVPRKYYRRIRAIIHNCQRFGVKSQNRDNNPVFKEHLYGHAYYIHGINPRLGMRLLDQLHRVDWGS